MEIQPASIAQIVKGKDGRMIQVDDDVQNVVNDICAIDDTLRVRFSDAAEYWVVYQEVPVPEGGTKEKLVTTSRTLDPRLVKRIEKVAHPAYDFTKELDKQDRAAESAQEHAFEEKVGEAGEKLAHALRRDTGAKRRAFVPKDAA